MKPAKAQTRRRVRKVKAYTVSLRTPDRNTLYVFNTNAFNIGDALRQGRYVINSLTVRVESKS